MIHRLDLKIVLTLIVTVALPLGISVYLVLRAIETSLGLGLNADLAAQLEQGIRIRRDYIKTLRNNAQQSFAQLADSHTFIGEVSDADDRGVEAALHRRLAQDPSLRQLRLKTVGGTSIQVSAAKRPDNIRTMTLERPFEFGRFSLLEAVYSVDEKILAEFEKAGKKFNTYHALVEAPPSYLKHRFILVYTVILGAIVVLSIAIGILWTRRLARRIHRLSEATLRVAEGDLAVSVDPGSDDEVGRLVESFNGMVAELEMSRARIVYLQKISAWQEVARRLAHEIKNPLTPIHLAAQQLRTKYAGDDLKFKHVLEQYTEIIEEEVATLRRLTTDFSSFARLPEVQPEWTDLGDFLAECEMALAHIAERDRVALTFDVPTEPIHVLFDRIMMKRVFDNLVRNAAEALKETSADEPRIRVSARKYGSAKRSEVEIRIEDNGPGIQPEHHPSIFDPYYTTKDSGTGLGLAISKKIVLEHEGQIWVEDPPGGGAAFVLVVPAANSTDGEMEQ